MSECECERKRGEKPRQRPCACPCVCVNTCIWGPPCRAPCCFSARVSGFVCTPLCFIRPAYCLFVTVRRFPPLGRQAIRPSSPSKLYWLLLPSHSGPICRYWLCWNAISVLRRRGSNNLNLTKHLLRPSGSRPWQRGPQEEQMYLRVRNRGSEKNASIVRRPVEEPVRPHQRGVQEATSTFELTSCRAGVNSEKCFGFFFFFNVRSQWADETLSGKTIVTCAPTLHSSSGREVTFRRSRGRTIFTVCAGRNRDFSPNSTMTAQRFQMNTVDNYDLSAWRWTSSPPHRCFKSNHTKLGEATTFNNVSDSCLKCTECIQGNMLLHEIPHLPENNNSSVSSDDIKR